MAEVKISALPAASMLSGAEKFPVVQGGITKAATTAALLLAPVIGDGLVFVSPETGNDANTGLSLGTAKRTVQAANDALAAAGGGVIQMLFGTSEEPLRNHPENANYKACVLLSPKVAIKGFGSGSIIKLPAGSAGMATGVAVAVVMPKTFAGSSDYLIEDVVIDGNAANQTASQNGIFWRKVSRVHHNRVVVTNCRGTATSGIEETFHYEVQACSDVSYTSCKALGTAGSTAAGFSANTTTEVRYIDCVASGMTVSNGFTLNDAAHVRHTNCWAYKNAGHGFNNEFSREVTYNDCTAGGRANPGAGNEAYPFTANQILGNTLHGFNMLGTIRATLNNCTSNYNLNSGIVFATNAEGRVNGGIVFENSQWGIFVDASSRPTVAIAGSPIVSNNPFGNVEGVTRTASTFVGAKVYRSSTFEVPTGAATKIPWNAEEYDKVSTDSNGSPESFHDNTTNPTRLTVPATEGGYYTVGATWHPNSAVPNEQRVYLRLYKNGGPIRGGAVELTGSGAASYLGLHVEVPVLLAANDYVEAEVFHTAGASLFTEQSLAAMWLTKVGV